MGAGCRIRCASNDEPPEKKALLEGVSDIFERGGKKKAEIDEETVRSLHAKIGELAVAKDFLSRKCRPWTGKSGAR